MQIKRIMVGAAVALSMAGVAPLAASSTTASPSPTTQSAVSREVPVVIDTVDGVELSEAEIQAYYELQASFEAAEQQAISRHSNQNAFANLNGEVSVVYINPNTPEQVKGAMQAAINDWASSVALHPNAPLEMTVNWTDLGNPNILGSAGADDYFLGGPWASPDWIPAPLANVLAGYDFNPGRPEVRISFNSAFSDWHFDHTTNPPSSKFDLYSVALHEIGHGMGFAGSAIQYFGEGADLDLQAGAALTYDRHVSFGDTPILEARTQSDPNAILTSGNLNFDLGGGRRYTTFAPSPFQNGSSYSHFDEATYGPGAAGALMTPSISNGEVQRSLDGPTLGVLAQIGWPMAVGVAEPTIQWTDTSAGEIQVGWSEDIFQKAVPAHYYNVSAYRSGVLDASVDVIWSDTSATLTNIQPGSDYEIVVTPVSATAYGQAGIVEVRSDNDPSDPEAPTAPGQPVITQQDEGRNSTITWPASTDNIGVTKYRVSRADNQALIKTVTSPKALLSFDIGTHGVYVEAVDAAGNTSGQSPQVQITVTADPIQDIANGSSFTPAHADVLRLYWAFFNRDPDTSGVAYWIDISNQGFSLDVIAEQFVVSEEFQNAYGSTTNEEFLRIVYFNVLGRSSDLSGYSYWLGQMNAGLSRGGVVRWIAANQEFIVQHPYPS